VIAPGTLAGLLPWIMTGWRADDDLGTSALITSGGVLLIVAGLVGLIESFGRFALEGIATPAPVTPSRRLLVNGFYRFVRNPMYVSVVAVVVGEALALGRAELLAYAAALWLVFHLFVVLYEEPMMRRMFPTDFADYSNRVRRWLPQVRTKI
jgi:protein-S-isoprenylcysteine O-methyltransferase Ste14